MKGTRQKKVHIKYTCTEEDDKLLLVDVLDRNSKLSKSLIKKLMVNGSVYQTYKGSKKKHVRKARITVKTGDLIECYYDPAINHDLEFDFNVLKETTNFGIYYKPPGAMTDGTLYGDKSSLIRHVQRIKKYVFLINRLDREIGGLVVVAYNSKTQNLLQQIWRDEVTKKYQAIVQGQLSGTGVFDKKINNKFTQTHYTCVKTLDDQTYVEIEAITERKNQIRMHFFENGNPIMGDPIYGKNNKNSDGLKLVSYSLEFKDPQTKKLVAVELPDQYKLF